MTKSSITKLWIAGTIVLVIGAVAGGIFLGLMLAFGGHWVPAQNGNGSDFIPNMGSTFWTPLILMISGFLIAMIGILIQAIAWIGALVNTFALAEKTWFIALLASGLLGLGFPVVAFAGMIAYLIAAPRVAFPTAPASVASTAAIGHS